MKQKLITRRAFIASASGVVAVTSLPGCLSASRLSDADRRTLVRMARLLYPHDRLTDETYVDVLQPLLDRAESEPSFLADLEAGIAMLVRHANGNWLEATTDTQIEAMKRLEGGAFFNLMQTAVRSRLYETPAVWKLIGYEGSSVEFGGYLHRGFDDIDWLPEE